MSCIDQHDVDRFLARVREEALQPYGWIAFGITTYGEALILSPTIQLPAAAPPPAREPAHDGRDAP